MKLFKKLISIGVIIVMSGMFLAGCGGKDDGGSKELNLFTWAGYVPDDVIASFEEETGITVNYANFDVNEEMLSKIQAQEGQFDVIICSNYMIDIMRNEGGLIQKLDWDKIPNSVNIEDAYRNPYYDPDDEYSIPYAPSSELIVYDPSKVSEPITGIADLWREELANKVVVLDGDRDIIGMTALKMGYSVNETDPAILEEIKDELMLLKPNIFKFDANTPHEAIISGDAVAGYMFGSQVTEAMNNAPGLEYVYPEEGMLFYTDNIVMPEGAPNSENAYKFMNYLLDGKVSAEISELINYINCNSAAKEYLSDEYLNNKAVNINRSEVNNPQETKAIGDAQTIYSEIWTEFKSK